MMTPGHGCGTHISAHGRYPLYPDIRTFVRLHLVSSLILILRVFKKTSRNLGSLISGQPVSKSSAKSVYNVRERKHVQVFPVYDIRTYTYWLPHNMVQLRHLIPISTTLLLSFPMWARWEQEVRADPVTVFCPVGI